MIRINLEKDIHSVSDFRTNTNKLIQQIKQDGRPMLLTQHGKGAVVIMDVREYESMQEEIALLKEIQTAKSEISRGEGIGHMSALELMKEKFDL